MKRFLLCMCVLLVLSLTACSKGSSNETASPPENLLSYEDVMLEQSGDKAIIHIGGEVYQAFKDVFSEYGPCYLVVALCDENYEWYYELELHQYDTEATQSYWYDYITEENGEITDGEFFEGGYTFPIDKQTLRAEKLTAVAVNIAVYDRGFIFDENFALWYQDGELKLEEGKGIPEFAKLPEAKVTEEPADEQKPINLTIYSVDDEESWFVIEGEDAKQFISDIGKGMEAELRINFDKMLDEYGSESVSWIEIYGDGKANYTAVIWNKAVDGYNIRTDGKYFRMYINTEKNIVALYLNAREYVKNRLSDESIVPEYKEKLRNVDNNATLFEGSEKCFITHNETYDGHEPWDIVDVQVNARYSFPIQYQVIMTEAYDEGFVSCAEDLNYFKPASEDYLVLHWGDDFSHATLISFGADGKLIDARQRNYAPGQAEWYSDRDDAKTVYHDANVMYIEYDVKNIGDTSLREYSRGRKWALHSMLDDKHSSPPWMCFSKPDLTQEDLSLKGIKLIDNPKDHLFDAELLTDDYIVMKDTYSPNDGKVQYTDVPRTIIDFYDETTHVSMGYVKFYTFESEAIAKQFHTNIENPNATVIGNRVYIKGTYGYNDQWSWSRNTEALIWNMGDPNQPSEVLWSRNYQTAEEFLEYPLYDEDLVNPY